ncbi:helix-turn-helix domain-containing protein [Halomonas binhaiensis]|uniref:Helix-turn-helix domain-containing protein n=1 Tax=Halomonas binhaiensis TaxID=2562282 RepID=A0A5C1NI08_9GAMM|nr:helix-turn-helix domain-containing protein [Halomonas binhaiensis]
MPTSPYLNAGYQAHCQTCSLRSVCLPLGLGEQDIAQFDGIIRNRITLKKGDVLIRQNSAFSSIYVVRSGSLKQVISDSHSCGKISHFYLPSELVGLDGIGREDYPGMVIALETSSVCELPFNRLDDLITYFPALRSQLYHAMSDELAGDHRMHCMYTQKDADQRLASFFLDLSRRFRCLGYSPYRFRLPMARSEVGSYLDMAVATVSRVLKRFQQQKMVTVSGRDIHIQDLNAMNCLIEEGGAAMRLATFSFGQVTTAQIGRRINLIDMHGQKETASGQKKGPIFRPAGAEVKGSTGRSVSYRSTKHLFMKPGL